MLQTALTGKQEKEDSMKSITRKISLLSAVALMAVCSFAGVKPASAQSIFANQGAARAAGVSSQGGAGYGGGYHANALQANDDTGSGGTTTAAADPYTAIFAQIQTATTSLLAGPGALSFGILILGLGFGVAWRLTTKGVKSIAK